VECVGGWGVREMRGREKGMILEGRGAWGKLKMFCEWKKLCHGGKKINFQFFVRNFFYGDKKMIILSL